MFCKHGLHTSMVTLYITLVWNIFIKLIEHDFFNTNFMTNEHKVCFSSVSSLAKCMFAFAASLCLVECWKHLVEDLKRASSLHCYSFSPSSLVCIRHILTKSIRSDSYLQVHDPCWETKATKFNSEATSKKSWPCSGVNLSK